MNRAMPPGPPARTPPGRAGTPAGGAPSAPARAGGPVVSYYDIRPTKVVDLRRAAGLSQAALSELTARNGAYVSRRAIEVIEQAEGEFHRATVKTAEAIAAALGVELSTLF